MRELTYLKKQIDSILQNSIEKASSSAKINRLKAFNSICEDLVNKSVPLKITLVTKFMTERGYKMSNQSIYNKQKGGNPYRELFNLWEEFDAIKQSSSKPVTKIKNTPDDFIESSDLKLIEDPALRYRISLMYGELKGLKKQNDLIRQTKEMNSIQSVPEYLIESKSAHEITLNDYEIEIIKEFVDSNAELSFNEDGALVANLPIRKGKTLTNQGLKDALLKVLKSYQVE